MAEGYYMHMGAWAGWKVSMLEGAAQNPFLETLAPTHEWVISAMTSLGTLPKTESNYQVIDSVAKF